MPPEIALRKFALRAAAGDAMTPIFPAGKENWLRLATLLLRDGSLRRYLDPHDSDEAVFYLCCIVSLENSDLDLRLKLDFVDACRSLFETRDAFEPRDGLASLMLWDNIRPRYSSGYPTPDVGRYDMPEPEKVALDERLLTAMLSLLETEDIDNQWSALYGLSLTRNPAVVPVIDAFMAGITDPELREWAQDARDFQLE